jgi:flagellar biosynthetic protein FliP
MALVWLVAWLLFGMPHPQMFVIVWNIWGITLTAVIVFDAAWVTDWWHERRHSLASRARLVRTLRFLQHFVEMAVAMVLGMVVLQLVASFLDARGIDVLSSPQPWLIAMSVCMAVPMVAWMRVRGHSWERGAEMAGAMIVPAVVCIALCAIELISSMTMLGLGHELMWIAMLALMLWRWTDYAHHVHGVQTTRIVPYIARRPLTSAR